MNALKRFWKDERGVAAIEYAIIAAVIAVALITIMVSIGSRIESKMGNINNEFDGVSGYDDTSGAGG